MAFSSADAHEAMKAASKFLIIQDLPMGGTCGTEYSLWGLQGSRGHRELFVQGQWV